MTVDLKALLGAKGYSRRSGKRVIPITFTPGAEDVEFALRLYREGGLAPVVDRTTGLTKSSRPTATSTLAASAAALSCRSRILIDKQIQSNWVQSRQ